MTARARSSAATARPRPRVREEAAEPRRQTRPQARPAARRRAMARPSGMAVWIPAIAILLGGIVWVNVARLQLTDQTSRVIQKSNSIRSENLRLDARLQQQNASVQEQARRRLGMDQPGPGQVPFPSVPQIPTR